jgi:hypothetical protein
MSAARPPDERDVLKTLVHLVGESRVYRTHLENARPVIERLNADMDDVALGLLWTTVEAALREPPLMGTPRHVEEHALRVLRDLEQVG